MKGTIFFALGDTIIFGRLKLLVLREGNFVKEFEFKMLNLKCGFRSVSG